MKTFLKRSALLLTMLIFIPLAGLSDTLRLKNGRQINGQYEGGNSRTIRFRTDAGVLEYALLAVSGLQISSTPTMSTDQSTWSAPSASFGPDQERLIRHWFSNRSNVANLPPGLAGRDSLPPGLKRQVVRNGTLPPGLERRLKPLPWSLERQLPSLYTGLERVILGRDVILMESATSKIVDLLRNVF